MTKRQFNFLLLLVFLHLILFAAFVCLPAASPAVKKAWADWQAKRQTQKDAAIAQANLQKVLTFSMPDKTLVYAEAPEDTAKLLTSTARIRALSPVPPMDQRSAQLLEVELVNIVKSTQWQPPVMLTRPDVLTAWGPTLPARVRGLGSAEAPTLLLHRMKTPAGQERLVCVWLNVRQQAHVMAAEGDVQPIEIETLRDFRVQVLDHTSTIPAVSTVMTISDPPEARSRILAKLLPRASGTRAGAARSAAENRIVDVQLQWGRRWRVFPGKVDPGDPTRLTIPIEIDGKLLSIEGKLNDGDRLMLTPTTGKLLSWQTGTSYVWDLGLGPVERPATRATGGTLPAGGTSKH